MTMQVRARRDERLGATVVSRRPLLYAEGSDRKEDRPAFVRAGSGLAQFGKWFAVVQDDADFVAFIDVASGRVDSVALPRRGTRARVFDDERGNKADKLDFEACFVASVRGTESLVAFGSGSTRSRESVLVLSADGDDFETRLVAVPSLYAAFRAAPAFSGSELNIATASFDSFSVATARRGVAFAR
jgi:hypothetical protein